jgi:hypothetical protein
MSKHIYAIALTVFGTLSLVTTGQAATAKTTNNSQGLHFGSPASSQILASTPRLSATCKGEEAPCITRPEATQSGNNIVFTWSMAGDVTNVRYQLAAGGEKQVENRTGRFTFRNVKPNSVYRISIQACEKHFLSRSTCTNWKTTSFTTN